jgi:sugar lactone lactonase YvrE
MTEQQSTVDTSVFSDIACELGESALWDPARARLHWIDITSRMIYTRGWGDGPTFALPTGDLIGSVGLRSAGGLIAALRDTIAYCDVDLGSVETVATLDDPAAGTRLNDGAVDPAGRFWVGSMDLAESSPTGSFFRVDPDLAITAAFGGIICSNGPAWSPDGRTVYHVDSTKQLIRAYDFDPEAGVVGPGRVFASDEGQPWFPDGVTVDAEGFVWNCKWAGGRIVRYDPDGAVDRVLRLPVPRPTRCAFVGPDLAQLAVTSARIGLDAPELAAAPLSGMVLLLDPEARGLPTPLFAG